MTKSINLRYLTIAILFAFILVSQYSFASARPLTANNLQVSNSRPEKVESRLPKKLDDGNYKSLFMSSLPKGTRVPSSGPSRRTNGVHN
ncbi:hypothetical protein L6452_05332 [Arctium lappa]|uniref:Uncharacterized protein n=1 Tax=Arctium lappa TaxID=4217 RepID=A0ACB9EFR8_ARCLA|nr:hypothetical protein L6452_05332 [Arctium lappa]